jgi:hypothetical protein
MRATSPVWRVVVVSVCLSDERVVVTTVAELPERAEYDASIVCVGGSCCLSQDAPWQNFSEPFWS